MYGVIEFEKKECAVVPLSWIIDDQKRCLWPPVTKQETLDEFVISKKNPSTSWNKYVIIKVHYLTVIYDEAVSYLTKVIEESSSSSGNADDYRESLTRKELSGVDTNSQVETHKRKLQSSKTISDCKKSKNESISNDEFSSDESTFEGDDSVSTYNFVAATVSTDSHSETPLSFSTPLNNAPMFRETSTPTSSTASTDTHPSLLSGRPKMETNLTEKLLRGIEQIKGTQEQQAILLQEILHVLRNQTNNIHLKERPSDYPTVPISNKTEYRAVENFLTHDENFAYMKNRLSTIGGSSVRNTVMNMLKYLLTNYIAMKFNWSGKDKRPFSRTKMCAVIIEAAKLSYSGREPSDLTDKVIKESIQDWLKLAKSRYTYSLKKKDK